MICSICQNEIKGQGNNPAPFRRDVCCDECNSSLILQMRAYLCGMFNSQLLVLTDDNKISFINVDKDKAPLELLQELVGGYIEIYPYKNDYFYLIVDEEGYPKGKQINELALEIFDINILGNLVLCPKDLMD